jgi:SAM-dependent MidA family methyltransferase
MPFDRFMALALYAPGMGYYANASRKFGAMPQSGSDFVTAPELTPLFGQTVAAQVAQALAATGTDEVWEFGAGTGALALQLLQALSADATAPIAQCRYTIVDLSGSLRERQQQTLAAYGDRVRWVSELPAQMHGVVIGNEVLDAMPVKLLARHQGVWNERGVVVHEGRLHWADKPTDERPPMAVEGEHDYLTEVHPQAEAFIRTLADRLTCGAAFFIDYGFPEHEYYHPQRHMGTLMCHQAHQAGGDPLHDVGLKDITAHVNFTGIALAAQDAGFDVLGYATQARFLMNCGLLSKMEQSSDAERAASQKLIMEHEMGELFKVIALGKPLGNHGQAVDWSPLGFTAGDRTHTL